MGRYLIAGVLLILVITVWYVTVGTRPEPEPEPPPLLLQIPRNYWAEAHGTITLGDNAVPGKVRVEYLVHPDQRVVIPSLSVWMDDLDLVTPFLWWEAAREPLRCTFFRNNGAIGGTLDNGELVIPAGAKVLGHSFLKRDADGECRGKARRLDSASNEELRITHDPDSNRFALSVAFDTSHEGNAFTVTLEAEGHYLNRPPVAALTGTGDNVKLAADGCPAPKSPANTAEGLQVTLQSGSYDPDGKWPEDFNPKRPRVDLAAEQWARSRPGGFRYLGAGQAIGPVLFETDQEHQLLLWVTDRHGAEGRKLCRFQVVPS